MKRYRAEVLGKIPYGLSHNDVFASFNMMIRERVRVQSVTKRRLAGNMISLIVAFETDEDASAEIAYAASSVLGFSYDAMIKEMS